MPETAAAFHFTATHAADFYTAFYHPQGYGPELAQTIRENFAGALASRISRALDAGGAVPVHRNADPVRGLAEDMLLLHRELPASLRLRVWTDKVSASVYTAAGHVLDIVLHPQPEVELPDEPVYERPEPAAPAGDAACGVLLRLRRAGEMLEFIVVQRDPSTGSWVTETHSGSDVPDWETRDSHAEAMQVAEAQADALRTGHIAEAMRRRSLGREMGLEDVRNAFTIERCRVPMHLQRG